VGSDEAIKIWWNGELVLARDLRRTIGFDQDLVGVTARKGWNVLLLKVHDQKGRWGFRVRVTAPDGSPLAGIVPASTPKDANAALTARAEARPFAGEVAGGAKAFLDARTHGAPNAAARDYFHLGLLHHIRSYDAIADRRAAQLLRKAAELDPKNAVYRFHYAEAASPPAEIAAEKEENKQRRGREEAIALDPDYVVAYRALASYYTRSLKNLDRAERLLRKALEVNPDYLEARFDLASVLDSRGLKAEAERERRQAAGDPRAAKIETAARAVAADLQRRGRAVDALLAWKRVLALDARSNDVRRRMVDLALAAHEREEALALLDAAWGYDVYALRQLSRKAKILEGAQDYAGAERGLRLALRVAPEDDKLLQALARVQRKAGKGKEALATYREALRINPKLSEIERYVNFLDPESAPFEDAYVIDVSPMIDAEKDYANEENDGWLHLLDQTVTKVNRDGTASSYVRNTIKILTDVGIKRFQRYYVRTWGGQAFKWKTARVIKADGSILEAKRTKQRGYRSADFPPLAAGDVIDVAHRTDERRQSFFGDYFGTEFLFATSVPLRLSTFTLITPAERRFHFHTRNSDAKPGMTLSEDGKTRIYNWSVRNSPKVRRERQMPRPRELYPQVQVTTYESWDAFATWWWSMIRDQHVASEEIKAKVVELIEGKKTRLEKLRAIYEFVAGEITYQAWEFGEHGYRPYTTTAIFDKREGDCKDKAILFNTMLKEIGVDAYPVLIRLEAGRSKEDLTLPMVGHFNHCISYVPDADGQGTELWLDGTAEYHSALLPPASDRGAQVVVVKPDGAELRTIPEAPPDAMGLDQSWKIKINADGSAVAEGELIWRGDLAVFIRRQFSVEGQRPIFLQGLASRFFGSVNLVSHDFDDLGDLSRARTSFRLKIEIASFVKDDDTLATAFLDMVSGIIGSARRPRREHDLLLGNPISFTTHATYELPEGWTVAVPPEDGEIEVAEATFVTRAQQEGRVLTLSRRAVLRGTRVSSDAYPAFRDALNKAASLYQQRWKVKRSGD
jgi:tetratricopeptide (TPR) repeat protein/transglutaminase-like putative cysteine protease